MTHNTLLPLTAFVHSRSNRLLVLQRSNAANLTQQWPMERIGDILVSECPWPLNGSTFVFWLGGRSVYSADVRNWIQKHLENHDVVRIYYIQGLPDDAHSSLKADLAELKAKAAAGPGDAKTEAIAWADAYLNDVGLTSYTDLLEARSRQAGADTTETFAWAAFAENGNVIIWSRQRSVVEPVATKYGRPVIPVIALDIRPVKSSKVVASAQKSRFMELLAKAEAIFVNGHAMVREWQAAAWTGNPDNEVVYFTYRRHDVDHYVILTEEAISDGHIDSHVRFHGVDHEGTSLSIQFYKLAPLTVNDLAIKS